MIWHHSPDRRRRTWNAIAIASGMLGMLLCLPTRQAALGCDTPVHRYAMYRWEPSPYIIFYLHNGQEKPSEDPANRRLSELVQTQLPQTNLQLYTVDVSNQEELENLPGLVQAVWNRSKDKPLPLHLVFTPHGSDIYVGRLDREAVDALISSEARTKLAEMLPRHNGVLIFLPGSKESENEAALNEVKNALQTAREKPLLDDLVPPASVDGQTQPYLNVGLLELSPSDPQEHWLNQSLLAVEQIEPEYQDLPKVYAVYGRGCALEPFIGKGIVEANLLESILFINGPCSCQVKEQNPGMDLLTSWDWERASLALAKAVGEETGNEELLVESLLGAALIGGAADPPLEPIVASSAPTAQSEPTMAESTVAKPVVAQGSAQSNSSLLPAPAPAQSSRMILVGFPLAIAVGVVLIGLVIATFVLLARNP